MMNSSCMRMRALVGKEFLQDHMSLLIVAAERSRLRLIHHQILAHCHVILLQAHGNTLLVKAIVDGIYVSVDNISSKLRAANQLKAYGLNHYCQSRDHCKAVYEHRQSIPAVYLFLASIGILMTTLARICRQLLAQEQENLLPTSLFQCN